LIGGAALAYKIGMPAVWFDIGGILAFAALAIMAKKIRKFEGMTTPEILGARYNRGSQYAGAIIILLAETAIVGYQIRAGAYVLNIISGLNADVGMIITAAFIISYTMFAGPVKTNASIWPSFISVAASP
jgi:SSS family solute:Na+ symporter